ncbi:MAG TPA: glycoside hydrolase family 3 N-terminal domain-containing protein, partial [Pilimelia sp.]|nr:glycoside hydrolase family 3 N-terminal domain-containing protein [Pilimelia sp.]
MSGVSRRTGLARTPVVLALCAALALGACGRQPPGANPVPSASGGTAAPAPATPSRPADPAAQAAATVAQLSDADLIGQVLMPYAYGNSATKVTPGSAAGNRKLAGVDTPAQMVAKYRLGGLILVGFSADDPTSGNQPTSNVDSPAQVRELTAGLQNAAAGLPARMPLLIGIDQEFGVVTRVKDGVTALPSALAFGAADDPRLTEQA